MAILPRLSKWWCGNGWRNLKTRWQKITSVTPPSHPLENHKLENFTDNSKRSGVRLRLGWVTSVTHRATGTKNRVTVTKIPVTAMITPMMVAKIRVTGPKTQMMATRTRKTMAKSPTIRATTATGMMKTATTTATPETRTILTTPRMTMEPREIAAKQPEWPDYRAVRNPSIDRRTNPADPTAGLLRPDSENTFGNRGTFPIPVHITGPN